MLSSSRRTSRISATMDLPPAESIAYVLGVFRLCGDVRNPSVQLPTASCTPAGSESAPFLLKPYGSHTTQAESLLVHPRACKPVPHT